VRQRIRLITLGVADSGAAKAFYAALARNPGFGLDDNGNVVLPSS
jgi:hypothetical protein